MCRELSESFSYVYRNTTAGYVHEFDSYTSAFNSAEFVGIEPFHVERFLVPGRFKQTCTRGRTMQPSHLFGKCACYVCKLAEFAGLANRRRHCPDCGFCMFLLCPKTFELAWNHKETFKQKTYSCMSDSSDPVSCARRAHETRLFMLWLCWTHRRSASVGLGKLPRELIRLIAKFVK